MTGHFAALHFMKSHLENPAGAINWTQWSGGLDKWGRLLRAAGQMGQSDRQMGQGCELRGVLVVKTASNSDSHLFGFTMFETIIQIVPRPPPRVSGRNNGGQNNNNSKARKTPHREGRKKKGGGGQRGGGSSAVKRGANVRSAAELIRSLTCITP